MPKTSIKEVPEIKTCKILKGIVAAKNIHSFKDLSV